MYGGPKTTNRVDWTTALVQINWFIQAQLLAFGANKIRLRWLTKNKK